MIHHLAPDTARSSYSIAYGAPLADGQHLSPQRLLSLFQEHGEDAARHLDGEYLVIVHDHTRGRCYVVRDRMGAVPCYYTVSEKNIHISTNFHELATRRETSKTLNEDFIRNTLSSEYRDQASTVLGDVKRLPAAHMLAFDSHDRCLKRYWNPEVRSDLTLLPSVSIIRDYRHLLLQAVMKRVVDNTVGVALSGGLDSSSILFLLNEGRRRFGYPKNIEVFSLRFNDRISDSHEAVLECASHVDCTVNWIPVDQSLSRLQLFRNGPLAWASAHPTALLQLPIFEAARRRNIRTVFMGHGGDDVLTPSPAYLGTLLQKRRFKDFYKEFIFSPFSNRSCLVGTLKGLARRNPNERLYRVFSSGIYPMANEVNHALAQACGVHVTSPLLDWRLAEYAMSLPEELLAWRGRQKIILREAMADYMPPQLRLWHNPNEYSPTVEELHKIHSAEIQRLFEKPILGKIDSAKLTEIQRGKDLDALYRAVDLERAIQMINAGALRTPATSTVSLTENVEVLPTENYSPWYKEFNGEKSISPMAQRPRV